MPREAGRGGVYPQLTLKTLFIMLLTSISRVERRPSERASSALCLPKLLQSYILLPHSKL